MDNTRPELKAKIIRETIRKKGMCVDRIYNPNQYWLETDHFGGNQKNLDKNEVAIDYGVAKLSETLLRENGYSRAADHLKLAIVEFEKKDN